MHTHDSGRIWERLWKAGVLHSCGGAFGGNYEGSFARFWDAQFDGLVEGATVLDVGTGNGAIPLLAKAAAARRSVGLDIHGVDLAAIDPVGSVPDGPNLYKGIRFHPRVALEDLPFDSSSVDLLCSHYAFEYASREQALEEVVRVLGHRGRAAFVLHSSDSLVSCTTAEQLDHCRFLFEESPLLDLVPPMLVTMERARNPAVARLLADDPVAERHRRAFNVAATAMSSRMERSGAPDFLRKAAEIIETAMREAARGGGQANLHWFRHAVSGLVDERSRLQAHCAAALDPAAAAALRDAFVSRGYASCILDRIHHDRGPLMGWSLTVARD